MLCDSWTPECYPGYPGIDNITDPIIVVRDLTRNKLVRYVH